MPKNFELVESSFIGKKYLMAAQVIETYTSGKQSVTYSYGIKTWVEGTNPDNGTNTWNFLQPDGSTVTVTNSYGGALSFATPPKPIQWL